VYRFHCENGSKHSYSRKEMMYEGAVQEEVGQNVNVGCGVEAGVREDAFYSKVGVSVGSGVEGVSDGRRLGAWVGKLVGGKDVDGASDG
jgi:hypothetical protein